MANNYVKFLSEN